MENRDNTGGKRDRSGKGRERQPDSVYPQQRNADEFGTHGGSRQGKAENEDRSDRAHGDGGQQGA